MSEIEYYDELKERDFGKLSNGKLYDENKKDDFFSDYFEARSQLKNIKDPIENAIEKHNFENNKELSLKYEIETLDDLKNRCKKILNIIKKSKKTKIMVITHGGTISDGIIPHCLCDFAYLDNNGYKYGSNCHITYIKYDSGNFKLITKPNTNHFGLFNESY
jgi:broad specificity phosphatase PhoE